MYEHKFELFDNEGEDARSICMTTESVFWPDVVDVFYNYLRACGFVISKKSFYDLLEERIVEITEAESDCSCCDNRKEKKHACC